MDTSTLNVLLAIGLSSVIALQVWTVKTIGTMRERIARLEAICERKNDEAPKRRYAA